MDQMNSNAVADTRRRASDRLPLPPKRQRERESMAPPPVQVPVVDLWLDDPNNPIPPPVVRQNAQFW